jgi:hypothetical protein
MAQDRGFASPQYFAGRNVQSSSMAFHRPFSPQDYEALQMQNPPSTLGIEEGRLFPQYKPPSQPTVVERLTVQPMEQENRSSASLTPAQHPKFNRKPYPPLPTYAPEFEFGQPPVPFWRRQIHRLQLYLDKYFVDWWLLEILSWCFSAICMAGIFGVLLFYNGKEIPQWPMGLTINGYISILSGLSKSALLLPTAEAIGQLKWVSDCSLARDQYSLKRKLTLSRIGSIRRSPEQ